MLILRENHRIAFFLRHTHRNNLFRQASAFNRSPSTLLAAQRKSILILPRNMKLLGDNFRSLSHGVHAIARFHRRIHKAPAKRSVFKFDRARKRSVGFGHHKRRPRHALHAAGQNKRQLAALNRPRRIGNSLHARPAKTIDRRPRNFLRQPSQKQRHARHVPIIFPRLISAAVKHVVKQPPIHARIPRHQRPNRYRRKIVGTNRRQRTTITPDGCPNRIANISLIHVSNFRTKPYRRFTQNTCEGRPCISRGAAAASRWEPRIYSGGRSKLSRLLRPDGLYREALGTKISRKSSAEHVREPMSSLERLFGKRCVCY